jgi:uncharacterized protein (DUF2062 family)/SAM-dependent methyltransferase
VSVISGDQRTLERAARSGLRRLVYAARTEGAGTPHETAAIALGVFVGCTPFYGFHLLICWVLGSLLRLNRLKMYLASNISNPLVAPWLVFAEVQTGSWLRRGTFHELSTETIRSADLSVFGADLLVGSLAVGLVLASATALATHAVLQGSTRSGPFVEMVRRAADRYVETSITAWEFARGKLFNDPLYYATTCNGMLRPGRTLVDVGCGQGLMLALLAEVPRTVRDERWLPGWAEPPIFERMVGIELRPRVAEMARRALGAEAEIVTGDARAIEGVPADAVLLFDVLHMMRPEQQESLVAMLAAALQPGGVMLIREADASAGWRFAAVRYGNRLKAIVFGSLRQEFHFRTVPDWRAFFARHGLHVDVVPMGTGTPFGNVLFRVTASPHDPAPIRPLAPPA